ncbi:Hypothetical predicted protein [Mytilus galloprovincialis]|uniref:Uncharacterized protein n=1 Tax=Mytilus galloprovincialis TaxID=29158 RepID=A0A8B6CS79_MYTGA|nr:Hypothetical predicted protein [Mytilus galloprovincialis]
MAAVTQIYIVKHYFTSSYHPQTNSALADQQTVIQFLKTILDENQSNLAELLPGILMAFRMSPSASSEFSPYHLLFGKEMNLPVDTTLLPKTDLNKNLKFHIENILDYPRRTEQPNFQEPEFNPDPSQNSQTNIQDSDEPVEDNSKQFYDIEKLLQRRKYEVAKDIQSKSVIVKSKKQKERDSTRIHSYIERKNIIRALPFSGMRNSAFVQHLDIANVLRTELKSVKQNIFKERNTNLEQQKCIEDLKLRLKKQQIIESERDQFKQELENIRKQKKESASPINVQEYEHQI